MTPDLIYIYIKKKRVGADSKKKKEGPVQIYRHKSSVKRIYINKLKPKQRGEGLEKQQNNCTIPPFKSPLCQTFFHNDDVCIITSGAHHTESSSHPGASFLEDLQRRKNKDGVNAPLVQR